MKCTLRPFIMDKVGFDPLNQTSELPMEEHNVVALSVDIAYTSPSIFISLRILSITLAIS